MSSFFWVKGVEMQHSSMSAAEAKRNFEYSCKLCTERGLDKRPCPACDIHNAHYAMVAALQAIEEAAASQEWVRNHKNRIKKITIIELG